MQLRNQIQKNVTAAIVENNYSGIIYVSPRVGKSKIVCDALKNKKIKNKKILIIAPYNTILDSWTVEFTKWKIPTSNITLANQRSLSKLNLNEYHNIICDEIHTLSDAQIEVLKEQSNPILGLTGSLSNDSKKLLKDTLNIQPIYTYSVDEAINDGIVSDYTVYLIPVDLDTKDKYIDAGSKTSPFKTTEFLNYQYLTEQFNKFKRAAWNNPKMEAIKMQFASKRASLIYSAKSKIKKVKEIIDKIDRCLIFTARIEIANELANSYHSKSDENNLEKFKNSEINKLAVCEMTNMGVTFPKLKTGIFHQMKSSEESAIQKVMRMCNIDGKEKAEIYITYFRNTVDEEWVRKALNGLDQTKIKEVTL